MIVKTTWTQIKNIAVTKGLATSIQFFEDPTGYQIFLVDSMLIFEAFIYIDTTTLNSADITDNNTDRTDFEDNFKVDANGNISINVLSSDAATNFVKWITKTSFDKGTNTNTLVNGVADAAFVSLETFVDNDDDITFTTLGNYTLSDDTKITVADNVAKLKETAGSVKIYPFTTSGNYTFDNTKISVTGGVAKLVSAGSRIGQWHLNESSGVTASDSSGNGNDGTTQNMEDADWVTGKLNNGIDFGGTDEFIDLGDIASFERTQAFSVEFWVKTSHNIASFLVGRLDNSANVRGWFSWMKTGGKLLFGVRNASGNRVEVESTTTIINDNLFHHVVITYDGSSTAAGVTMYVDGSPVGNTTISDTLSATTINSVNATIGKYGGGSAFIGTLDEVVIYNEEITSTQVSNRYNSGTGTEDLEFDTSDPTIIGNDALIFAGPLTSFVETATKIGSEIKYQISSDDGTTWKYWNGSVWTTITASQTNSFYFSNESNDTTVVNTNITDLAASGTFKFRAFLHSNDGTASPDLDNLVVAEPVTYSTTSDLYLETKDAAQIASATILSWLTTTISHGKPVNTDVKILFSVDGRVNWLTWSGSAWVAPISPILRIHATLPATAEANFASLPLGNGTLDVRIFLVTANASVTPFVDNINVISNAGFNTTGEYESNIFDSGAFSLAWRKVEFNVVLKSGTTLILKARANNDSGSMGDYGGALVNDQETNLVGRFIQWKAEFTSTGLNSDEVDSIGFNFPTPTIIEVQP